MKKVSLFCLSMLAFASAFGQFNQGRMMVGGSGTFSVTTDKDKVGNTSVVNGTSVSIGLTPQFGYFIMDNLAVGGQLQISASSFNRREGDSESSSFTSTIGPFARYYFGPGIITEAGFGFGTRSFKFTSGNGTTTETDYVLSSLHLGLGYAFFLNDNVAVEPMLVYRTNSARVVDSDPKAKNIDGGVYLQVGFQIYLGK